RPLHSPRCMLPHRAAPTMPKGMKRLTATSLLSLSRLLQRAPLASLVSLAGLAGLACGGASASVPTGSTTTTASNAQRAAVGSGSSMGNGNAAGKRAAYTLTILHTNVVHSRVDPVKDDDAAFGLGGGIGGVLRRKAAIDRIRKERGADHVLLFDAGDFSVGTAWYTVWGGAESVTAM